MVAQSATVPMKLLKSYLSKTLKALDIKITRSDRHYYHIRFPMKGDLRSFNTNTFLSRSGFKVSDSQINISQKYNGYVLTLTKEVDGIPAGTSIEWVNCDPSQASSGPQLFANKELAPSNLGLADKQVTLDQLIEAVAQVLQDKYDEDVSSQLIKLMNLSSTKKDKVELSDIDFDKKDLTKLSADFGEILAAIRAMSKMGFKEVYFPAASNKKLIDFYGVRMDIKYPISVKSGCGGKVTIQNIIDSIESRAKTANHPTHSQEKALEIIKIVSDFTAKEQMLRIHQYMGTEVVRDLAKIMNTHPEYITLASVKQWCDKREMDEIAKELKDWHNQYSMPRARTFEGNDKYRMILSPLGETIVKILNNDREIQQSLTNMAKQISLIQLNVNVSAQSLTFNSNYFKELEFEFAWPGYSSGNKLGFKTKEGNYKIDSRLRINEAYDKEKILEVLDELSAGSQALTEESRNLSPLKK